MDQIIARQFNKEDVNQLWQLMYELALFEGYDRDFMVTEESLVTHGLCEQPKFHCFVAHESEEDELLGMAVVHRIDWTFDLKPTLVLKELYVKADARGMKVGENLMKAVAKHANQIGAARVKWLVLNDNDKAKGFYKKIGASVDTVWENWQVDEAVISKLSNE